ncbi:hypothetical protein TFLX_02740 [Thermoflexales bacterium]|nr:hypothetical protein TFLX_02740 [Thermoflexales bacterium]
MLDLTCKQSFNIRNGSGSNALVQLAFFALLLGFMVALLALPTGLADWSDLPCTAPAWRLGLIHMTLNVTVTVLVVLNLGMRLAWCQTAPYHAPRPFSFAARSIERAPGSGSLRLATPPARTRRQSPTVA